MAFFRGFPIHKRPEGFAPALRSPLQHAFSIKAAYLIFIVFLTPFFNNHFVYSFFTAFGTLMVAVL